LEKLIHILEWVRQLDQHLPYTGQANGRPTKDCLASPLLAPLSRCVIPIIVFLFIARSIYYGSLFFVFF
jgi:hypothetical protein